MCCLKYEVAAYEEFNQNAPPLWSEIETEEGLGTVVAYQVPKRQVIVELEGGRRIEIPLAGLISRGEQHSKKFRRQR
jgi:cell fate regulator YaaT (PSP1 superfamily)